MIKCGIIWGATLSTLLAMQESSIPPNHAWRRLTFKEIMESAHVDMREGLLSRAYNKAIFVKRQRLLWGHIVSEEEFLNSTICRVIKG